jgi:hypothetical protein
MSHIPEDELHAYLDQALGRPQCVVIESHLAGCAECRAQRDAIAALRDHTTLLLGRATPPRRIPPSFEELRRRTAPAPISPRRRAVQRGVMAASLVGALMVGYALKSLDQPGAPIAPGEPLVPVPMPVTNPAESERGAPERVAARDPQSRVPALLAEAQSQALPSTPTEPDVAPPASIELSTDTLPAEEDARLEGLWRTVPWDGIQAAAGREPSRVMGVPVEEVQVQPSRQEGGKPVTVVAQRLSSGEVIQTIEGPTADVSQLLSRRGDGGLDSAGRPAEALRQGDRMIVVTGQLPSDSLRALVRRVNAAMRVR